MPKIPDGMLRNDDNIEVMWTARCKASYKQLTSKDKNLFVTFYQELLDLKNVTAKYGVHFLKGYKNINEAHLEPNTSATDKPLKRKGKMITIFKLSGAGLLIIDVGDHSILNNDYSDFK